MPADVGVSVAGTATAHVGDALSYTISVRNAGPNVASATQLTYRLAAGLTPGSVSSAGAVCTTSGSVITCNLNDLAVASSVDVTVNATAAAVGTQSSIAAVTTSAADQVSANNSSTAITTVSSVPAPSGKGGGGGLSLWDTLVLAILAVMRINGPRRRVWLRATPRGAPASDVLLPRRRIP
jgi:uncharacterized repeat protein (TIGR01451 family)